VQYRASFDRSLAAILALMLVVLTLGVTWAEARLRRRAGSYLTVARATRRPPAIVPLGRWRWPALAFCGVVVALALGVPTATIVWWLVRGAAHGASVEFAADGALNSFLVGALAAIGSVLLVIPIGLLVARYPSRLTGLIERATFTGYALPGIVIALAVVFIATSTVPLLYQTIALLVVAYAVRFLPQAIGGVRAALVAQGSRLEEAGRTLGDGPVRVFLRLTVPFLRPAMVAGGALVFLTTVKELPMALLLGPIGFDTLATQIWDAASEGFYARAAAPASILLVLSFLSVAILLRADEGPR
jgi:iron(III) transport system permease protein